MHSIALLAVKRAGSSGRIGAIGSARVFDGANTPLARCHLSKHSRMSAARSLITGRLASGPIVSLPPLATFDTWVRQVQRGLPFTVIAQEPHMPTPQAEGNDKSAARG